jgi:hypothetical protein
MLSAVKELASFLASDPLTVDQVIKHLGSLTQDYGSNVTIKPRDPKFKEAEVVREIGQTTLKSSNRPAFLSLTPVEPPTLVSLAAMFGPYKKIAAEEKNPAQVIFYLDQPGKPYTVALIGEIKADKVVRITLRRDVRLE